ncbi:hypothetical protein AC240_03100 [Ralstonia sp. MD27]|nr:hypothetical protein AC240_03100 [Ralstonia sp. MD27]MBA9857237.1 hypothetical protein [Ralstonia insidiosa]MBA9870566.1 hypothetical protein [Ralstonia insidiosa]MBA9914425.1 hypothetical protein [Ralstonia insidiosa]MBA9937203.1 hypothetical protein [Ralstonia insidiosa]
MVLSTTSIDKLRHLGLQLSDEPSFSADHLAYLQRKIEVLLGAQLCISSEDMDIDQHVLTALLINVPKILVAMLFFSIFGVDMS